MSSRLPSAREELASTFVHGAALVASFATIPLLFQRTEPKSVNIASIAANAVFAATLILLYLCSTLYHALPDGRARAVLLRLDHGAIYLFIAGSFTPFALTSLDSSSDWMLLSLVWLLAIFGFILKGYGRLSHPQVSTGLYLLMGWAVLTIAAPSFQRMPSSGLFWLVAGGIAYTIGVVFFALDSCVRYAHAVWHGFVVAGTSCHFVAVLSLSR